MGCSASRPHTLITRPTEERPTNSSSSHSSSSYSDSSSTPVSRTLSLPTPLVHHPPLRKGDTNHLVSLTSTTYGSLVLVDPIPKPNPNWNTLDRSNSLPSQPHTTKTLTDPKEPSSPDSVINTWELMEGLDDFDFDIIHSTKPNSSIYDSPIESPKKPNSHRSVKKAFDSDELVKSFEFVEHKDSKPLWKHLSEESLLAKMDPNVASRYRQALSSKQLGYKDTKPKTVRQIVSSYSSTTSSLSPSNQFYLAGTEDRIVLYYTSLRGIRRTYEDCCAVLNIFRGFRVYVDERDISMDSTYRKELQSTLGGKVVTLPQVFIRGKYIGGADEVKQLHEVGELAMLLEGFPLRDCGTVCESCGDARFVPCPNCNGSRKVFEEEEGKLRRCSDCNENGLIRCPICCS
uniref:Glutaredoxin domain-containing protein n=1 Tax=Davidia involucrata TaxID=16924 RepID=A0A5B7A1Q1_DAVIN